MSTNYDKLHSMKKEELATFLDEHCRFEDSPWMKLFDSKYCENCSPIEVESDIPDFPRYRQEVSFCELNRYCKFFPDEGDIPDTKDMIMIWLESEVDDSIKV